jgi:hypothetical protein
MARRGATQKRRRSHSSSKGAKAKTIPELRRSLDHISQYTDSLIASGKKDTKAMASAFAKEWHATFGKKLDQRTAEDYVRHVASVKPKVGKKTLKNKKQRGGAQDTELTGAPLAALTRPGVDIPYGNFLPYVNKGFDVGVPQEAILLDSGKQEGVLPYAETGSNQVGGRRRRTRRALKGGGSGSVFSNLFSPVTNLWNAASMRPFIAQNPTSYQQDAMISWKGQVPSPGGQAYQHTWQPRLSATAMPSTPFGIYDRELTSDVTSIGR